MTVYKFDKRESRYGGDGWILQGAPDTFDPLSGMGVAHDLLEHKRNDDGSKEDELMALGAMLFVRGEGGYFHLFPHHPMASTDPGYQMSGDLERLWQGDEHWEGACWDPVADPGRTHRLGEDVEAWIDSAVKYVREEIEYDTCFERERARATAYLDAIPGWLRKGYRYARRRYARCSAGELTHMFHTIQEEADRMLKVCDVGERMEVEITACRCKVDVRLVSWWGDEYEGY